MIPSHEDFLNAACRWRGEHKGIHYELSWHGRSDFSPQGTWCWYIFVNSEQFYTEDWLKLRLEKMDKQFSEKGRFHRHWSYDTFPDLEAHGGWTWGEQTTYLGGDGKEYEQVKVGCDYAHLWDRERDYPDDKLSIERDVKRSIDMLIEMFPRRRERCGYSGMWGDPEQFYTAKNGARVHLSQQDELRKDDWWTHWGPADAAA